MTAYSHSLVGSGLTRQEQDQSLHIRLDTMTHIADNLPKPMGSTGPMGPTGIGITGPPVEIGYAYFYAIMPNDNPDEINPGDAVTFIREGPSSGIVTPNIGMTGYGFDIQTTGLYMITMCASITEIGQLVLCINDNEQPETVVGRDTLTSQIIGINIIRAFTGDVISIRNPSTNTGNLTITPSAGGVTPVSASLTFILLFVEPDPH